MATWAARRGSHRHVRRTFSTLAPPTATITIFSTCPVEAGRWSSVRSGTACWISYGSARRHSTRCRRKAAGAISGRPACIDLHIDGGRFKQVSTTTSLTRKVSLGNAVLGGCIPSPLITGTFDWRCRDTWMHRARMKCFRCSRISSQLAPHLRPNICSVLGVVR